MTGEWRFDERGKCEHVRIGGVTIHAPGSDGQVDLEQGCEWVTSVPFAQLQAYVRFHEGRQAMREREEENAREEAAEDGKESPAPQIIDLMEALKASLAAAATRGAKVRLADVAEEVDHDEAGLAFVRGYEGDR